MRNIPYYIALVLILVMSQMPAKAMSPEELEKGQVKKIGPCMVQGEPLHCIIIELGGNTYSMAGFVKDKDFYARYIGKQMKDKWVIVWSYGGGV